MSGIPLSGTINPNPLETSNHLITPVNSMRLVAVSSTSSLTVPGRRLVPDIFDSIPSDAMTPYAAALLAPLDGRFDESCGIEDNTGQRSAKGNYVLAHSPVHNAAHDESAGDERTERVADIIVDDQIGDIVKLSGLTIDDDKRCPVAVDKQGKPCRRPHHKRRPDRKKQITAFGHSLGVLNSLRWHRLTK